MLNRHTFALLLALCCSIAAHSQPVYYPGNVNGGSGIPGTQKRNPLNSLERSTAQGRTILTDNFNNQRWTDYVYITPTPVEFTPTPTGNTSNINSFVTDPSADVYYIDWTGRAVRLYSAAAGGDKDWLNISDNQIPQAVTNAIYNRNYAAVGGRYLWPGGGVHMFVVDSTTESQAVNAGLRGARYGLYNFIAGQGGYYGLSGSGLDVRGLNGVTNFTMGTAGGTNPAAPSAPFTNYLEVNFANQYVRMHSYPNSRVDTSTVLNFLYTDPQGIVQSRPTSQLVPNYGTYIDDAAAATAGVAVGQLYYVALGNPYGLPPGMPKKRLAWLALLLAAPVGRLRFRPGRIARAALLAIAGLLVIRSNAQTIVGGSGACVVVGDPNAIATLRYQQPAQECLTVVDTVSWIRYRYDGSQLPGFRWIADTLAVLTEYPIVGGGGNLDPVRIDYGTNVNDVVYWNGSSWVIGPLPGGGGVLPVNQIGYGTGAGITSSPKFKVNPSTAGILDSGSISGIAFLGDAGNHGQANFGAAKIKTEFTSLSYTDKLLINKFDKNGTDGRDTGVYYTVYASRANDQNTIASGGVDTTANRTTSWCFNCNNDGSRQNTSFGGFGQNYEFYYTPSGDGRKWMEMNGTHVFNNGLNYRHMLWYGDHRSNADSLGFNRSAEGRQLDYIYFGNSRLQSKWDFFMRLEANVLAGRDSARITFDGSGPNYYPLTQDGLGLVRKNGSYLDLADDRLSVSTSTALPEFVSKGGTGIGFGNSAYPLANGVLFYLGSTNDEGFKFFRAGQSDTWEISKNATDLFFRNGSFTPVSISKTAINNALTISANGNIGLGTGSSPDKLYIVAPTGYTGGALISANGGSQTASGAATYYTNVGTTGANWLYAFLGAASVPSNAYGIQVQNTANTSAASAKVEIVSNNTSADVILDFQPGGGGRYAVGVANSAANDPFRVTATSNINSEILYQVDDPSNQHRFGDGDGNFTDLFPGRTATPEASQPANPGSVSGANISGVGALYGKYSGTGNTGWGKFLNLIDPNSASSGQVLTWNGTTWAPATPTAYTVGTFQTTGDANGLSLSGSQFRAHRVTTTTPGMLSTLDDTKSGYLRTETTDAYNFVAKNLGTGLYGYAFQNSSSTTIAEVTADQTAGGNVFLNLGGQQAGRGLDNFISCDGDELTVKVFDGLTGVFRTATTQQEQYVDVNTAGNLNADYSIQYISLSTTGAMTIPNTFPDGTVLSLWNLSGGGVTVTIQADTGESIVGGSFTFTATNDKAQLKKRGTAWYRWN